MHRELQVVRMHQVFQSSCIAQGWLPFQMFTYSHFCSDHIKYFTSTCFKVNNFVGLTYVRMTHFDLHSVFSSTELCQAVLQVVI
jgi:hypothetical protein